MEQASFLGDLAYESPSSAERPRLSAVASDSLDYTLNQPQVTTMVHSHLYLSFKVQLSEKCISTVLRKQLGSSMTA